MAIPVKDLAGRRVLVIEDDYVIATDLVDMLSSVGAVPVGPIGRVDEALALASDQSVALDLAILDVDLHGTATYGVVDALTARGVPVVLTTGFSSDALDPAYRALPRLEKPVGQRALLALLRART